METRDLLVEIGTEEIPARMLLAGVEDLARRLEEALQRAHLAPGTVESFGTPRRLAVRMTAIPLVQPDREEWAYGPSVAVAFDAQGRPNRAAGGFARAQGVSVEDLRRVQGPKGEVIAVQRRQAGRTAMEWLTENLPLILQGLSFPKSMRWGIGEGPFVRPVHWLLVLFGNDVVPCGFCGVSSSRTTRGHRFLDPGPFEVSEPGRYEQVLRDHHVEPDPEVRLEQIRQELSRAGAQEGGRFVADEAVVQEVANLVEWPVFGMGNFDPAFLELPKEVLISAMASHQRFFALERPDGGLLPRFAVVSNTPARDMGVVLRGNERVLAVRLYDARFFYQQDLKTGIEEMARRLPERLFLKDAGDMAVKSLRIRDIALRLWKVLGLPVDRREAVGRAAVWCKADLMSAMVGEFPELQGTMGMYYARAAGAEEGICQAIREHYLPRYARDALPSSPEGAVLAAADRLDTLAACFRVGAVPTGSKDPLGLRRAAIGLLRLVLEIPSLADLPLSQWLDAVGDWDPETRQRVEAFLAERFRNLLVEDFGLPTDVAQAVGERLFDQSPPAALVRRGTALAAFIRSNRGFGEFLDQVFKRVGNLLRKAEEDLPGWRARAIAEGLLDQERDHRRSSDTPQEAAVEGLRWEVWGRMRDLGVEQDAESVLEALFAFRDPLARFFGTGKDGVPVLIEPEESLRLRRLALLARVANLFDGFADFGRISTR